MNIWIKFWIEISNLQFYKINVTCLYNETHNLTDELNLPWTNSSPLIRSFSTSHVILTSYKSSQLIIWRPCLQSYFYSRASYEQLWITYTLGIVRKNNKMKLENPLLRQCKSYYNILPSSNDNKTEVTKSLQTKLCSTE